MDDSEYTETSSRTENRRHRNRSRSDAAEKALSDKQEAANALTCLATNGIVQKQIPNNTTRDMNRVHASGDDECQEQSAEQTDFATPTKAPAKRRRSRTPAKNSKSDHGSEPVTKRRPHNNPKRVKTDLKDHADTEKSIISPKKRGRPRKSKGDITNSDQTSKNDKESTGMGILPFKKSARGRQKSVELSKNSEESNLTPVSPMKYAPISLEQIAILAIRNHNIPVPLKMKTKFLDLGDRHLETSSENDDNLVEKNMERNPSSNGSDHDDAEQIYQPLTLVNTCVKQLQNGVDEKSYLCLINRSLQRNYELAENETEGQLKGNECEEHSKTESVADDKHIFQADESVKSTGDGSLSTSNSSKNPLFKDRDEASILAAELLTRLPHSHIENDAKDNNVVKLSDIQPTITLEENQQYFDQQLVLPVPPTANQNRNESTIQDNAMPYLPNNGYLMQNFSNIPSAHSAFSSPQQHSSPATNFAASDILYQTNNFTGNGSQPSFWNQGGRRNFAAIPMGGTNELNVRRNGMLLNNWCAGEQIQPLVNTMNNGMGDQNPTVMACPPEMMPTNNYNYDQMLPENGTFNSRPDCSDGNLMNQNTGVNPQEGMFERRTEGFRQQQLANYQMNVDDLQQGIQQQRHTVMPLQPGVLEDMASTMPGCEVLQSGHGGLPNHNTGGLVCELNNMQTFSDLNRSLGGQMQYFQPLSLPDNFDVLPPSPKRRRRSKASRTRGSEDHEYMNCLNDVLYKPHEGLQPLQPKDTVKDDFYLILSPEVNEEEVKDIGHNGLIAKYIDYLIIENEEITEMSKAVSIPIEHCVMDDPYLMDIINVKMPFPSIKYFQWLRTHYPNIQVDWKALNRQMMRFQSMGDCGRQLSFMIDRRPVPVLLGESFYFFQRERDRLLAC